MFQQASYCGVESIVIILEIIWLSVFLNDFYAFASD